MSHWILTEDRAQSIISALDKEIMTLRAAKLYYSTYGCIVKGNTKERFIKNLMKMVRSTN